MLLTKPYNSFYPLPPAWKIIKNKYNNHTNTILDNNILLRSTDFCQIPNPHQQVKHII